MNNLPDCFTNYRRIDVAHKCVNCMVDVLCAANGPVANRRLLPYTPKDAVIRLMFSEMVTKKQIKYNLPRLYNFNFESGKTLLRTFRGFVPPSTEIDCYRLIYRHIIGRAVRHVLLHVTEPIAEDYFDEVIPNVEPGWAQVGGEQKPPERARLAVVSVGTVKHYGLMPKLQRIIVLKHMFRDNEDPPFESRLGDLQAFFDVQGWRFPKAPVRFFILDKK